MRAERREHVYEIIRFFVLERMMNGANRNDWISQREMLTFCAGDSG